MPSPLRTCAATVVSAETFGQALRVPRCARSLIDGHVTSWPASRHLAVGTPRCIAQAGSHPAGLSHTDARFVRNTLAHMFRCLTRAIYRRRQSAGNKHGSGHGWFPERISLRSTRAGTYACFLGWACRSKGSLKHTHRGFRDSCQCSQDT